MIMINVKTRGELQKNTSGVIHCEITTQEGVKSMYQRSWYNQLHLNIEGSPIKI